LYDHGSNPDFNGMPLFDVNISETVKDRDIATMELKHAVGLLNGVFE